MSATSTMSKKRYQEIADMLGCIIGDDAKLQEALANIREIMKFDPETKQVTTGRPSAPYNEKTAQYIKNYRQRQKEKGISTYISSGAKGYYYSHKQDAGQQAVATQ